MGNIIQLYARQILDSRGNPTIEVEVITDVGSMAKLVCHLVHLQANMKL